MYISGPMNPPYITVYSMGSHSLKVEWVPYEAGKARGEIVEYTVDYKLADSESPIRQRVSGATREYIITGNMQCDVSGNMSKL